ncbi:Os09g0565750 [Oryza sativa Japonica Group]|uniref:Os09g0565750 protein n=1 Tax=Oryza sativa subsp. japonica TaxID=39947 RepID=A0A0P0XQE5_ORYSJ|nr:Os09g0565750 [Oryza sativa Japonica Group]
MGAGERSVMVSGRGRLETGSRSRSSGGAAWSARAGLMLLLLSPFTRGTRRMAAQVACQWAREKGVAHGGRTAVDLGMWAGRSAGEVSILRRSPEARRARRGVGGGKGPRRAARRGEG